MEDMWVIGDPHFYHKNIIDYENRPFKNVDDMNEGLIKNWNTLVDKQDKIIVLGDFCFGSRNKIEEVTSRLHGYKILILGNHDSYSPSVYIDAGFKEVYKYPIIYDRFWILSHEPMYINENMPYANIFAHVHSNPEYRDISSHSFCASIERPSMNYGPIKISQIRKLIAENSN